ncbi:AT-rich interactive domain-containing protein 3C isoform X4 [Heliangelus exortis]|uniref:AT-rich interactive domain-containing protein 3C isoform X4 n=1 Tax=Heliangelus exortis TaxID=472823 RepID=UPI003A921BC5
MVENPSLAAKPALPAAPPRGPGTAGGLRLAAVMESLQRQQAARLARGPDGSPRRPPSEPGPGPVPGPPPASRCRPAPGPRPLPAAAGEEEEVEREEEEVEEEEREPHDPPPPPHHEWTYEEQFKQLYELDEDPKRKEFLDDLFSFMQKRGKGTPVNRIPIMAKQVLDLYTLYRLVTDKGGLVEVINKKIWREITKGLNLPTSITSAAFTLRTQYMKYLYPYECEKQALSSPGELQAAIDSNRREGRRQSFGTALFNYSPASTPALLGSHKMPLPALSISTHTCSQLGQVHAVKKDDRQETALNLSTNGISSINMSIEINGVVYTGILFARRPPAPSGGSTQSQPNTVLVPNPLLPTPSHSHTPTSTSL